MELVFYSSSYILFVTKYRGAIRQIYPTVQPLHSWTLKMQAAGHIPEYLAFVLKSSTTSNMLDLLNYSGNS